MNIEIAKNAGFCFGVKRATDRLEEAIAKDTGERLYTLGTLIHNDVYNQQLAEQGVRITTIGEVKELAESYNDSRVVCMYAADAKYTGVDMADASFRAKYCQTSSDVSHLNADGMYLVAPVFDKWLAEAYAKYKGVTLTNSADEEQFLEVKETETNAPEASASPETTEAPTETKPGAEKSGCGSAVANGIALITVILAAAAVLKKKD